MRIDALNKVNQLYQTTKTKKVTTKNDARAKDHYEVSQTAQDYQTAKAAVANVSDVREDKVAGLKDAIASGSYNVSAQEIADKMVSRYFDSIF